MKAMLTIGWAMIVVGSFVGGLGYAYEGHQWRALCLGLVCVLVILLRHEIIEEP